MKSKKYFLILILLLVAGGLFGLWRWGGEMLGSLRGPVRTADGKTDYAGYLNRKLDGMPSREQDAFLYEFAGGLQGPALLEVITQQRTVKPMWRARVTEILATRLGESAPEAGWTAIQEIVPYPDRAGRALFIGWGAKDFDGARRAAEAVQDKSRKNNLLGEIFKVKAATDPAAAANASIAEIYEKKDPALIDILEIWAETDREAAVNFALKNDRAGRLRGIFTNWLAENPQTALARLQAMDAKQRESAVGAILKNDYFMRFNPKEARELLDRFPSPDSDKQRQRYARFFWNQFFVAPQATLAEVLALQDPKLQAKSLDSLLSEIRDVDPQQVLDILKQWMPLAGEQEKKDVFSSNIWVLAQKDPMATLLFLQEMPKSERDRNNWMSNCFRNLPPESLEKGKAILAQMDISNKNLSLNLYIAFAENLYKHNPKNALAWLGDIPDKEMKNFAASGILAECAKKNLSQAMDLYKYMSEEQGLSVSAQTILFGQEDIANPEEVADWTFKNIKGYERGFLLQQLAEKVAKKDPMAAIALWDKMREGDAKDRMAESVAGAIVENAPESAMKLADSLNDPELAQKMRSKIFAEIAQSDFETGLGMLRDPEFAAMALEESKKDWRRESSILNALVMVDSARVLETIEAMPEGYRGPMLESYAASLANTDPLSAMELLIEHSENGKPANLERVFSSWTNYDAAGAIAWLDERTEGDNAYLPLYAQGMGEWLEQDPGNASAWLAAQPAGSTRDSMVVALVSTQSKSDPEAAFTWAKTIDDTDMRKNSVMNVFNQWSKRDPEAARQAVESSTIPPQWKSEILRQGGVQ